MTIARSIETRMLEGIRRDFLADADVATEYGTKVYIGPLFDDANDITPPQINLAIMPGVFELGVGGATGQEISILVKIYRPVTEHRVFAAGETTPHDWLYHLQLILASGSVDPHTEAANGQGYVLDPDYDSDPLPDPALATRWLTTSLTGFRDMPALILPDDSALVMPFLAMYTTRVDNRTRLRV
jgi:hypothetical protein